MFGDRLKAMNQVMIITGGSRSIGAATAYIAAQHGYVVWSKRSNKERFAS